MTAWAFNEGPFLFLTPAEDDSAPESSSLPSEEVEEESEMEIVTGNGFFLSGETDADELRGGDTDIVQRVDLIDSRTISRSCFCLFHSLLAGSGGWTTPFVPECGTVVFLPLTVRRLAMVRWLWKLECPTGTEI